MKKLHVLMLAGMVFHTCLAIANEKDKANYQALYDKCVTDNGPINNGVVDMCSNKTSDAAKKEINQLYQRLYKSFFESSPGDELKLEQAQKAWLSYRNTHCALAANHVGSPMYAFCPMQMNIQRVNELREMAGE
jgi:uncharacterized protein YecT (DUF1311 family)